MCVGVVVMCEWGSYVCWLICTFVYIISIHNLVELNILVNTPVLLCIHTYVPMYNNNTDPVLMNVYCTYIVMLLPPSMYITSWVFLAHCRKERESVTS